jgi:hypothetical protein
MKAEKAAKKRGEVFQMDEEALIGVQESSSGDSEL